MTSSPQIAIVMPMRNDWSACQHLFDDLDQHLSAVPSVTVDIHVIDDYSLPAHFPRIRTQHIRHVYSTRLVHNVGHQRAIALGLIKLTMDYEYDAVVIMDADGEDCPADVLRLIEQFNATKHSVVVAQRKKRSEGIVFRFFYTIYKRTFFILTGQTIDFGNFCLIPFAMLPSLVYSPGLWNHLAATLVASPLPIEKIQTHRCQRYAGNSSMNLTSLIVHGLSAISIFLETIAVRMLIGAALVCTLTLIGIACVVGIRFFTDLAIPGWATTTVGLFTVVIGQTIILILLVTFNVLQQRSALQIIPYRDTVHFIESHQLLSNKSE